MRRLLVGMMTVLARFLKSWQWLRAQTRSLGQRRPTARLEVEALEERAVPAHLGILVPAYFYPSPSGSPWGQLTTAAATVRITAIMNPNSGPGATFDANYAAAVNDLRAAGG